MRTPPAPDDAPGYVYAYLVPCPDNPNIVLIKLGRSNSPNRRIFEHLNRCGPALRPIFLGVWPQPAGGSQPDELYAGHIVTGPPVPYAALLEKLLHLCLADLAQNRPYVLAPWPFGIRFVPASAATAAGLRAGPKPWTTPCGSCTLLLPSLKRSR